MKKEIIDNLDMEDILHKYDIRTNRTMFHCPFHEDKNASAKCYEKTFYCFSCNRTGDFIQFVQYLFGLSFKEAMQKINEDFGLNIEINTKFDYEKINKIKRERQKRKEEYDRLNDKYVNLCDKRLSLQRKIEKIKHEINLRNWENEGAEKAYLQEKLELIDLELDNLFNKLYYYQK